MDIHSEEIGKKCMELLTSFDYSFHPIEKKSLKDATELLAIYQKGKNSNLPKSLRQYI
jgi:hypothetical protein